MKSLLQWNQYAFRESRISDSVVIITAPTFVEALNTFHELTHIEPFSVECVGCCYLLDSEIS